MTNRFFFDTSALIKLYHQEDGTETLDRLLLENEPVIVISEICIVEMTSAFAKKVHTQEITKDVFKEAVTAFEEDLSAFEVLYVVQDVYTHAVSLLKTRGVDQGLRTLDALQLASALKGNEMTLPKKGRAATTKVHNST